MNFSRFLDIQSWWEVPSIAYFCSLFRTAFNLLDFDIEELEEALLTDGTEESASSLLTELIVRLLNGCLGNNDISAFNYQMYLRRLFRRKCQETGRYNPFNTDIDFQFLPLRTKVEILYALCDFRLDADDVFELFKNLEAESLRVEPLGWDDNDSAYWYFYGTRLYREDIIKKPKGRSKKKKVKESKKRGWFYGDDWLDDDETERVWQVVCFTEEDWSHLTEKFSKASSKVEKELYRSLSQNFLPEIPRLFQEKERLQRKRLLELPRRTSSRVLQKIKQKEEDKQNSNNSKEEEERKDTPDLARENRAKRRNLLRSKSLSSDTSSSSKSEKEEVPAKMSKRSKSHDKRSKNGSASHKREPPPEPPVKTGRKTNNSLASVTGQIVIPDNDDPPPSSNCTRKKLKTSQIFGQTEEDIQTDMYKVLEQLTAHEDAWPFMDPVEEKYAPNYYTVIRRPMDLHKMEERLDSGYYTDFSMFNADFKLIVNNCRLYNGQDNEYTQMVDKLQAAFDRLTEKYMHRLSSSDEEIAVEYQLPTPSRKHKRKTSESPSRHKRKKRKSHSETGEPKSSSSNAVQEVKPEKADAEADAKSKESQKSKIGKNKKKRKGHHRHGKHSKNHKKNSHKGTHGKHGKKQKHSKERGGKKSKQKKKKSKHQEEHEPEEVLKHSVSQESLESSNRSRSASPLPSIHTPTPSPEPPEDTDQRDQSNNSKTDDQLPDPEFYKDKYDKIKERRRHAAKDAWESLFDYKQRSVDKQKQNLHIPEKEKNQKLRETIEKLKAKNEKYKDTSLFNSLFAAGSSRNENRHKISKSSAHKDNIDNSESSEEENDAPKGSNKNKKGHKKNTARNESASEALEQAVKDISKWLDDAPKHTTISSPCDSPAQTISTEEHDNSRLDDEFSQSERVPLTKKEISRKRPSSREPKVIKRREIQRTIERLQPGKSKGNLLTNMSTKNTEKLEDTSSPLGPLSKTRDNNKTDESSPKLSLGSVLPTVEFTLGNDHKFAKDKEKKPEELKEIKPSENSKVENDGKSPPTKQSTSVGPDKKDAEVETEPITITKPSQEKATPNLSAWFKAFGTPKSTIASTTIKKKVDESETSEKAAENVNNNDVKSASPKQAKFDSPNEVDSLNPDGGDSPLPNATVSSRQRRTSTGSSVSERSSFSQDLDSPRHQMSHTSPLLRSPASPRTDDFQKITYPIINGTIRAGFYQDTTSIKSSPEKSCSPREAPQSPYSPYSQHVYANSNMGSSTPNYFVDHNKSPLPTYSQNQPSYYDSTKASMVNKASRVNDDYTTLGPENYQQNQYTGQFSPAHSPYSPHGQPTNYSSTCQSSSQVSPNNTNTNHASSTHLPSDAKNTLFPVKKRTYTETDLSLSTATIKKVADVKEAAILPANKNDIQKIAQTIHNLSSMSNQSVDDIALALSEKSEMAKLNNLREKSVAYNEKHTENKDIYEICEDIHDRKKELNKTIAMTKQDNVDMVNMGYLNPEIDKRNTLETHEPDYAAHKSNLNPQPKGYEVEAIAINLGLNGQQMQKAIQKCANIPTNLTPAHSHNEINSNLTHANHNPYDTISSGQTISNFSLNDIELANKKLYACNSASTAAIDYGNWKMTGQMRKQDMLPSDYSTNYNSNHSEKVKSDHNLVTNTAAINYNKNLQHQQYHNYNMPRSNIQRTEGTQQSLSAELRIPNPRGLLKGEQISAASSMSETDLVSKNIDSHAKMQKPDKVVQNHPLVSSPYKTPYTAHSTLPLDGLRNIPNLPHMLERYTNDERYLQGFASSSASLYHEKSYQMAQMFNKSLPAEVHPVTTSVGAYSQPSQSTGKDSVIYKSTVINNPHSMDSKAKNKRKRTSDAKPATIVGSQSFLSCGTDVLSTVKTSMVPGSAFNFGTTTNMALGTGLYGDNSGFSIEDIRNSTNLMAANYMAAAVAHQQQQRNSVEASTEKMAKPAHQNSSHGTGSFPFIGHGQVRAGYGFVGDAGSPLYQQYLQRHQEEILRQTGAQIMGLYPPTYPSALAGRQPYDSINRPSWL